MNPFQQAVIARHPRAYAKQGVFTGYWYICKPGWPAGWGNTEPAAWEAAAKNLEKL